jgi:hypothetical protein
MKGYEGSSQREWGPNLRAVSAARGRPCLGDLVKVQDRIFVYVYESLRVSMSVCVNVCVNVCIQACVHARSMFIFMFMCEFCYASRTENFQGMDIDMDISMGMGIDMGMNTDMNTDMDTTMGMESDLDMNNLTDITQKGDI